MRSYSVLGSLFILALMITLLVGEIKCVVKMVKCNFEPIGKAEIFYTVGTFTGLGCIIGYIDIKDN